MYYEINVDNFTSLWNGFWALRLVGFFSFFMKCLFSVRGWVRFGLACVWEYISYVPLRSLLFFGSGYSLSIGMRFICCLKTKYKFVKEILIVKRAKSRWNELLLRTDLLCSGNTFIIYIYIYSFFFKAMCLNVCRISPINQKFKTLWNELSSLMSVRVESSMKK